MGFLNVLPWVEDLIDDFTNEELSVTAGLGSGKTHGEVQWLIHRCLINNESPKAAFTEPLYRLLRSAAIPTFRRVLYDMGWSEGSDFRVNQGAPVPSIKLLRTKQEILLFSASTPEAIIADEYHCFAMDEAGESKALAFQNLQARTRCSKAKVRQGLCGGAPQGITHFCDLFGLPEEGGPDGWKEIGPRDYVNEKLSRRRIQLRTHDNPYVNGGDVVGYVRRLYRQYGHNPNLVRSYIYGEFCPLFEGSAYKFVPGRHVLQKAVEPDPLRDVYITFDFNAYPMAWVGVQIIPFETPNGIIKKYTVVKEGGENLRGLDEALFDVAKSFPRKDFKQSKFLIFGDRTGHAKSHKTNQSDFERIRRELSTVYDHVQIRASKRVAPEVASVEAVNFMFLQDRIAVNPSCSDIQRSWQATRWKDGTRQLDKPSGETHTHKGDAFKYLIHQLEVEDALSTKKKIYGING